MDSIKRNGQSAQLAPSAAQNLTNNSTAQVRKTSTTTTQQNLAQADGAPLRSRNQVGVKKTNSQGSNQTGGNGSQGGTFNENDTFNKHYNKELRVSKDEIPIVLGELNDSAIQFIKREQWEKALNLLQKAYGIMDVVDFNLCRRDKFNLFILFHNMALCYQKQQQLEECAQCIEQALEYIPADQFNLEEKSVSNRMRKLQLLCKLKLQYCAILSQVHRHKDALEQSKEGVRISHHIINDLRQLCEFYVKREDIEHTYNNGSAAGVNSSVSQPLNQNSRNAGIINDSENTYNSYRSQRKERKFNGIGSRNRSFSQFLSQQEAYNSDSSQLMFHQSSVSSNVRNSAFLLRPGNLVQEHPHNQSSHNLSQFYSLNFLEESMSYIERTARKLMPILNEIKKRMVSEKTVKEKTRKNAGARSKGVETLDSVHEDVLTDGGDSTQDEKKTQADMKNILGYLNQGEWTTTLSIGSIMQLQAVSMKDLLEQGKNELELNRDSFISKVSMLAVAYFCYSTEIRFILQMKEDPSYEPGLKQKESEYWHAKSLEIACTFLPSECPLLSHINLSYQKHFAPVKQTILEEETVTDDLKVVKPLFGVDNPKFQPIIRHLSNIQVSITPYQMTPLNQVTSQFLSQIQSFNEYQEQAQLSNILPQSSLKSNPNQLHIKSKSGDNLASQIQQHANHKRITTADQNQLQSRVLDSSSSKQQIVNQTTSKLRVQNNTSITTGVQQFSQEDEDLLKFERLLDKLIRENKIDKLDLFKRLQGGSQGAGGGNILEERESYHSNDALMDEQIMAAEDDEEDSQAADQIAEDEEHIGLEAQRQTATNNLYKFRNPEAERPKTSNGNGRMQHQDHQQQNPIEEKMSQMEKISQYHKHLEEKKKGQGRPLSGGLQQKLKSEGQKPRINKISNPHHNMSMYDKFSSGPSLAINGSSPERNISHLTQFNQSAGQKQVSGGQSQYLTQNQIIAQSKNQSASSHLQAAHQKLQVVPTNQTPFTQQNQSAAIQKLQVPQQAIQSNLTDKKGVDPTNLQAYDELKKRLLSEYKKLTSGKKSFDEQVREKYKNLKQRAVSGKKVTSHQIPNPTIPPQPNGSSVVSSQQLQQFQINQMSPRHHINSYKPSFLLGDNNGQIPNKEIEMIDQMNKKYRPSSKQGQQIQGIQQQPILASGRSGSIGGPINTSAVAVGQPNQGNIPLGVYHHDRNMSTNYPPSSQGLLSNQQIMGLIIGNQDKKNSVSQQSSNPSQQIQTANAKKASLKSTVAQSSQPHQDITYVKQFMNDQQQKQQQSIAVKQNSQTNLQQKGGVNGYSTQQQFNQFQSFQGMPQSHYHGNPNAHAYKMNPSSEQQPGKRSTSQNVNQGPNPGITSTGIMQGQSSNSLKHIQATSQQTQYEKLKKKLQNY